MKNRFIVLEGPDGSGTTTHTRLLCSSLAASSHEVLATAEPTGGAIGAWIRSLLRSDTLLSPASLQLLFTADRADHVASLIQPALSSGKIVLSDRYAASTVVYGEASGIDPLWLEDMNKIFVQPDLCILLFPPLETCLQRLGTRSSTEIFERSDLQKRIHAAYRSYARRHPEVTVIDSSGPVDSVAAQILSLLQPLI